MKLHYTMQQHNAIGHTNTAPLPFKRDKPPYACLRFAIPGRPSLVNQALLAPLIKRKVCSCIALPVNE